LCQKEVENQILSWESENDHALRKKKIRCLKLKKSTLLIEECLVLRVSQRDKRKNIEKNMRSLLKSIVLIAIKKQS